MESIIQKIVEIDKIAQERLKSAYDAKQASLEELKATNKDVSAQLKKKADERIKKIEQAETEFTKQQKQLIEEDTKKSISRLENIYNKNHDRYVDEIFNNIINN